MYGKCKNAAACRLSEPYTTEIKKTDHKNVVSFFVCVRQNLVFRAVFGSVSDDKYFLIPYFLNSNLYSASANFLEKIGGTAFPIILYASACVPTNS